MGACNTKRARSSVPLAGAAAEQPRREPQAPITSPQDQQEAADTVADLPPPRPGLAGQAHVDAPLKKGSSWLRTLRGDDEIQSLYDIGRKLGSGSFAVVKQGVRKADGLKVAIKIIKKSKLTKDDLAVLMDEVEIMERVDHPNCVKFYEFFETPKKLYIVMELLTGGEVFDRIVKKGSYSEAEAANLIRQCASALKYLHAIGITHRDLKPENLIYQTTEDNSPVKITDFGLAKLKEGVGSIDNVLTTACGTPGYVAPEVLKSQKYSSTVDIWSLGVILYILLCGFPPFYHESTAALYKQIKSGKFTFPSPYWDGVSEEAKDLVCGMLTVDPATRLTDQGVLDHPWVSGSKQSHADMGSQYAKNLRHHLLVRKFRVAIRMVVAVYRLLDIMQRVGEQKEAKNSHHKRHSAHEVKDENLSVEYHQVFDLFDKDRSGAITVDEFDAVLSAVGRQFNKPYSKSMVSKLVREHGDTSDGTIDFDGFVTIMSRSQQMKSSDLSRRLEVSDDELFEAFQLFDKDNSGTIEVEEISRMLAALGIDITEGEIHQIVEAVDKNGDGLIDIGEFKALMEARPVA